MKGLFRLAFAISTLACASTSQTPAANPPATTSAGGSPQVPTSLSMYEGTYALEAPSRTIELRVWVGDDRKLRGQLTGLSQETTFRPGGDHKFLHATSDDIWFLFTVEDGRATSAMMHQRGRVISGPRIR